MMEEINFEELKVNGIKVNYYFICQRKLWLFDRKISMEDKSDKVLLGILLHEESYKRENAKEILIDNLISIDIVDNLNIREVKYSDKMEEADKMQILYYLYYLKRLGIEKKGIINYPKQKKKEYIELTPEYEKKIEEILAEINKILKKDKPPTVIDAPYCKKCAYYEFCYG
ncbi:CRISPR-associated protein Cas4 [Venenivibrio stagnispumantis]|uniref:CRISPR-associated exonuclease Cas4 n=1 Tax=Venenivibrio stagnispumantis TaxID=407998 RepID=A0AA45WNN4_9AQUI|nr:CRISPR-associated protein Cas4 [Venenivibrio stagnispumantis]MCW4573825.1 CRISPR-associated protein Cas4 [Venenivibrio stagnispumantis]SMP18961.1 CRISPR-associated exonuclease Cas4 [Venenivibrio stagnispumantis]